MPQRAKLIKYCKTMKDSCATTTVGGMGSCLNLDLCMGASSVLERLRGVNPGSITTVSLEYNLMAELVFDQEWMEIMEEIGSLPFINTVSLSFRIPVPLPMQAFTKLIDEAVSLETLNLVGLQLSEKQVSSRKAERRNKESPVESMIEAFRESKDLRNVQLCRYRPFKAASTRNYVDPLLLALSNLPRCKVFHIDRTDVFSDPTIRDLVFRAPFPTFKIGPQEKTINLELYLPLVAFPMAENPKLKELIILQLLPDETLAPLAELLQHNRSLEKVSILRLQSNNFGHLLGAALAENTVLESLELNVVLRDRAEFRKNVGLLASSLGNSGRSSALTTLKLDAKGVRSSSLITDPFLKMLRNDNFVLQNLIINRNAIPLSNDILFYLKLNKIGRNYFLNDTEEHAEGGLVGLAGAKGLDFREQWAHMLIEHKMDVPVLHYFICRNPLILTQS